MGSTDLTVDCIPSPVMAFGSLLAGEVREASLPLPLRVADVARLGHVLQDLLTATSNSRSRGTTSAAPCGAAGTDARPRPQRERGLLPTTFTEGFEGAGYGTFSTVAGLRPPVPRRSPTDTAASTTTPTSRTPTTTGGNTSCFRDSPTPCQQRLRLARTRHQLPRRRPRLPGEQRAALGRAPRGGQRRHHAPQAARRDPHHAIPSTSAGTASPPCSASSTRSGSRTATTIPGRPTWRWTEASFKSSSPTPSGTAVGTWRKIYPYENVYDDRSEDRLHQLHVRSHRRRSTEDDYFDPADAVRRLGPSSTCSPSSPSPGRGDLLDATFDPADIHHASDGPGLQGSLGPGTWVEASSTSPASGAGACGCASSSPRSRSRRHHHAAGVGLEPHRSRRRLVHRRRAGHRTR